MEDATFQLEITPSKQLVFEGDLSKTLKVPLTVKNKTHHRQAYKVKCTSNDLFRIRPPVGCLEGNQTETVIVEWRGTAVTGTTTPPEDEAHHVGVYHIPAPDGAGPRGVWSEHHGPPIGTSRMPIYFKDTEKKQD